MPATVSGWDFVSNSPNASDPTLGADHADGRKQVTYTVQFDDLSPVAIKVSQGAATSGLTFYNDPTIVNNSGYDFTTFRVSGVSVNNTFAQNLPAQEHVVHPRFAHFHDATLPGWSSPSGISYNEFLGFNTSKGVLTNFSPAKGINGADELWMYNGSPVANGTQQAWQDIGMHQFPLQPLPTGGQEGGDFYVVYQPNFWPFHDRIMPTHHSVHEDTGATNSYVGTDKNDLAFGYGGTDTMQGLAGDDVLVGGADSDDLQGGDGGDWLFGGDDNDLLTSGAGADMVDGGAGKDVAIFWDETLPVTVSLEEELQGGFTPVRVNGTIQDLLINVEDIWGGSGNDKITGDENDNYLAGQDGNDVLRGGDNMDAINGGGGVDTADFKDKAERVFLELKDADWASATVDGVHEDWVLDVENVWGGSGDDRLVGNSSNNHLVGGEGKDVLRGRNGADKLNGGNGADKLNGGNGADKVYGGDGNDSLWGGANKDSFVFDFKPNKSTNKDAIKDFRVVDDTIVLENAFFKVGSSLSSSEFRVNTTGKAQDRNDKIIYDKDSGVLYYDANGSAAGRSTAFATIGKNLKLTYHDFDTI